jgi:hypothetical protein
VTRPQPATSAVTWPEGKRFAFTIFDDPDSQTLEASRAVYSFLSDLGFRTTKGVWPVRGSRPPSDHGGTCAEPDYLAWCIELQRRGFEIGLHNATLHTSYREETRAGLDRFAEQFGGPPRTMAHHYYCDENLYWGEGRVSGAQRLIYNLLTRFQNRNKFFGHVAGHPCFWGDLCRERITYVRNFVFGEINTLKACPYMPYHDPDRPLVNQWYASSEGANVNSFVRTIQEEAQDRLEAEGGASIMYTHFGHGYWKDGQLNPRFVELMTRLSRKNGWFVPVGTLLDHLRAQRGELVLTARQRGELERRWIWHKARYGTA